MTTYSQILYQVKKKQKSSRECCDEIHHRLTAAVHCGHPRMCSSRRLQLNPAKSEVIWCGIKASLKKMENIDLTLHVGNDVIGSASSVRDLGVILDCELSMKKQISKFSSICYFRLWRLKTVRRILGEKTIAILVQAFVISRLDYCNSILAGLPKSSIIPL